MTLANRPEYDLVANSLRIGSRESIRNHIRLLMLSPNVNTG